MIHSLMGSSDICSFQGNDSTADVRLANDLLKPIKNNPK